MIFAIVAWFIRMISKIHMQIVGGFAISSELWWDDLAVTVSLFFVIGFCILTVPLTNLGYGRDVWTVPFKNLTPIVKVSCPKALA